ncbi:MAG: methionyl-tRNA formyltransferase [Candidatus Omnitrophica bacterium]|nr:methionyl-tRNA formyltransferase [Candidatus Omnitrophota bacterium]
MKIVFFGCDDFAAVNLARLIEDKHNIVALVTQPDRPKGRGMHVTFSATKQVALAHGVEVFQPETLKDPAVLERLRTFDVDLFIVIAYGKFLPPEVLNIPKIFCINAHGSLLPKYRGAAPVNYAVIGGEKETGVTLMKMSPTMDGGEVIATVSCPIPDDMTSIELRAQLAHMSAELVSGTLPKIKAGAYVLLKQDESLVTYAPKMHKDMGHINWVLPAWHIHNLVRGLQPWPGAFTFWQGHLLKILDAAPALSPRFGMPGEIVGVHKDGFLVKASDHAVLIRRIHLANAKPMDARSFLAGHKLTEGEILG